MAAGNLARRLRGFLGVGAIGFVVDVGAFTLFVTVAALGPYAARVLAFLAALSTTFLLNRALVWRERAEARTARQAGRYLAASLVAGACNLAAYAAIVATFGDTFPLPHLALASGVGVGLVVNFMLYDRLVFRAPPDRHTPV